MAPGKPKIVPIPEPRGLPYLGNVREFRSEDSLKDLARLHDTYGDIFRLRFTGFTCIFVGSHKLVNEICDETRFKKSIQAEIAEIRLVTGDGLFTAENEEENWGLAHRILMPAFGPLAIQGMFSEMYDIVTQMALKWARYGPRNPIPASDDFTRLALDTLGLCSMGFRFNSFYKDELHPFVQSMADTLVELGNRTSRPNWASIFYRSSERKLMRDIDLMRRTSDELIKARRADAAGNQRKDLLTAMMDGVDAWSGKKLSDESIINNLVTFLVAGHETTSGTLAFAFYSMIKNPHAYQKAQQEVDTLMGCAPITVDKLYMLKYIPAVLRETLRQFSPIPGITIEPYEDTLLDGKYLAKKGEPIAAVFSRSHLDPRVFGEDAHEFKPGRRPFAWQEMLLATSLLLQNFDFQLDDPSYNLKIAETLTIKPKDFFMRASLRHGMSPLDMERNLRGEGSKMGAPVAQEKLATTAAASQGNSTTAKSISIFYGSNSGTCEALAHRLASSAPAHGFRTSVIDSVDTAKARLPQDHLVVILLSSYEEVDNVPYAVFGAGNSEWRQTFHRIPRLVDDSLEKHGAERVAPMGLTNVSERDPFLDFETWEDDILWPALETKYLVATSDDQIDVTGLKVDVSTPRILTLRQNVKEAVVTAARDLTTPGRTQKRHMEIQLPTGVSYEAGDYLIVLPMNPRGTVARVFRRLRLSWDAVLTIHGTEGTLLPLENPTSASDLLSSYVELSQPATRKNVLALAALAEAGCAKDELKSLAEGDNFERQVAQKRLSVLDLLERYPTLEVSVGTFLAMLPPMRTRQYSISSSPLHDPYHATITYSVLEEASLSRHGKHVGVATNYLASLRPGDRLHVSVRPSHIAFHLPRCPETTPIICIAAGAGLAPFLGFIQQRATQMQAGRTLAPALLIYGCRGMGDDLYREEFDAWEAAGAVTVRRAYSRAKERTSGCKYVQDRMFEQKETLGDLWERGAKLFVCGSRRVGNAVEAACVELLSELKQTDKESVREFMAEIRNERFVADVFD
ncbi:hypothetical protein VTI74DRAFT_11119 [Chaetomium olivicolor]